MEGLIPGLPTDTEIHECPGSLYEIVWHLHITNTSLYGLRGVLDSPRLLATPIQYKSCINSCYTVFLMTKNVCTCSLQEQLFLNIFSPQLAESVHVQSWIETQGDLYFMKVDLRPAQ